MSTDPLERIVPVARPVLAAVDRALATLGAPPDHPLWTVLRRVGAVPGDAVDGVLGLDPASLRETADLLRERARTYDEVTLPGAGQWRGAAAQEYQRRAASLAAQLSGPPPSMSAQLSATAAYLDAVADWCARSRDDVARALAEALTSAQAGRLRTPTDGDDASALLAAADVATHVLDAVSAVVASGEVLHDAWSGRLGVLADRAHPGPGTGVAMTTVIEVGP